DLVHRAARLGIEALALTDHDGLYGAIRFHKACKEAGIKPIIGAELTLEQGSHLTLLAKDHTGYSNLCRLITRAQISNKKGSPALSLNQLAQHSKGLICLSGCRKGEIAGLILSGKIREAREAASTLLNIFGKDRFWIELQNNFYPEDRELLEALTQLAHSLQVNCVATSNVHYAVKDDHRLHDVLLCIKNRTTLDHCQALKLNSEFHLKSPEEMKELFRSCPESVLNTLALARECNVSLDFSAYRFPEFPLPGGERVDAYLARLCLEKSKERYGSLSDEADRRLRYELDLIGRLDLAGYFLIVWDIMEYARRNGIPAQGRGSAANSIVAYILGITKVDPIKNKLFLGRFLNEEMSSLPDIDVDISTSHREKLIQYVYQKYGQEHTAMVCTFVTFQARNAIREVGKALGLPEPLLDLMAKSVSSYGAADIEEDLGKIDRFRTYLASGIWQEFISLCGKIADFPRHLSIHVGGMLISSCPLTDIVPLEKAAMPGRIVCQWDKDGIADAGLIKIDLLGLRMLSLIEEARQMAEKSKGMRINLNELSLDDSEVYDMISRADTIGVFQVESRAQIQTLPQTRPRSIEDLTIEVAIIRPGPLQGNMVHPYLQRRKGREEVSYLHSKLKPILEETLGVILFQEQVIQAAVLIAGFRPGEADALRRAMSRKRSRQEMGKMRQRFLEGADRNGVDGETAERIFASLEGFAEYGFCKSHAAGFALLCYQSAWLKRYHPAEFYAALLNNQPMGFYD
ncbi:MAG: DNA polymerase III subunit alpha, partial [Deltaproteobacteria bacterium]